MGAFTDKPQSDIPFKEIFMGLTQKVSVDFFEAVQFFDDAEGELRRYDVYKITADGQTYVLKKSEAAEVGIYRDFLEGQGFKVPGYLGSGEYDRKTWLLMEYIEGNDLRDFTEEMAYGCADSITAVMNAYWQRDEQEFVNRKLDQRFEKYWKRINKRAQCLEEEPLLRQAYSVFLQRQLTCRHSATVTFCSIMLFCGTGISISLTGPLPGSCPIRWILPGSLPTGRRTAGHFLSIWRMNTGRSMCVRYMRNCWTSRSGNNIAGISGCPC